MPAVSKAQQRFMGMVHAVKKGDMAAPSLEVAQAAASMKKKDAKDFASTKHKGLPNKKEVEEAYYGGEEQRRKDEKKAKYEKQLKKMLPKRAFDQLGREIDPRSGKLKEESNHQSHCQGKKKMKETFTIDPKSHREQQRAKKIRDRTKTGDEGSEIAKKKVKGPSLFGEALRSSIISDRKAMAKISDNERKNKEQDARMKHGKRWKEFTRDIERVRSKGKGIRGTHKGKWGTFSKGVFTPDN